MESSEDAFFSIPHNSSSNCTLTNETNFDLIESDSTVFQMSKLYYALITCFYVCIFVIGVLGNVLVIVVIAKDRRMRNTANMYLISLGIADLMIISCCLPVAAYELHSEEVWDLGPVLCKLAPLLQYLSTNASISTMVAISIERFIVICRPFKVRTYCTTRRAAGFILILWIFSFVCSFPLLIFTLHKPAYHEKFKQQVHVCFIDYFESEAYFFFHQAAFYILPGLMLSLLYSKIIFTLRRFKSERFGNSPDSRKNKGPGGRSNTETNQLIVMLSTVVLFYFLCLLPYNIIIFITLISPQIIFGLGPLGYYILLDTARILFFLNSCSNPILYNVISGKFRSAFLRLFCIGKYRTNYPDSRTASFRSGQIILHNGAGRLDDIRSSGNIGGENSTGKNSKRRRKRTSNDGKIEQRELCWINGYRRKERTSEPSWRRFRKERSERLQKVQVRAPAINANCKQASL